MQTHRAYLSSANYLLLGLARRLETYLIMKVVNDYCRGIIGRVGLANV